MRSAQVYARVLTTAGAPQPLPVEQLSTGQLKRRQPLGALDRIAERFVWRAYFKDGLAARKQRVSRVRGPARGPSLKGDKPLAQLS